jgi:hypothetical protein
MVHTPAFKYWMAEYSRKLKGLKSAEQLVEESMAPDNLRVEVKDAGKWVEAPTD